MSRTVSRAVTRAQAGDRDALAFLYVRYAQDVYGYALSILHDPHEAQDVTQQVFAKLIVVIGKYQERDVPFLAWILTVTRNIALDHLRRRQPIPVAEVRGADPRAELTVSAPRAGELTDALATLPSAQREVLLLRHLVGLSPGEIATRIGRSEGAVHGLHHRGRRALKAELSSRAAAPTTARPRPAGAAGI